MFSMKIIPFKFAVVWVMIGLAGLYPVGTKPLIQVVSDVVNDWEPVSNIAVHLSWYALNRIPFWL